MVWPTKSGNDNGNSATERREFHLHRLPAPPGLNASYKIIRKYAPKTQQTYSSLGKTDDALRWQGVCAEAMLHQMQRQGIKAMHKAVLNPKTRKYDIAPERDEPWYVTAYYRLVTSRADADAPVKMLIDSALLDALGLDDMWVGSVLGTKRFAEHRGERSTAKGASKLIETPYIHIVLVCQRLEHQSEFNERSCDRESDLLAMMGVSEPLPDTGIPHEKRREGA